MPEMTKEEKIDVLQGIVWDISYKHPDDDDALFRVGNTFKFDIVEGELVGVRIVDEAGDLVLLLADASNQNEIEVDWSVAGAPHKVSIIAPLNDGRLRLIINVDSEEGGPSFVCYDADGGPLGNRTKGPQN